MVRSVAMTRGWGDLLSCSRNSIPAFYSVIPLLIGIILFLGFCFPSNAQVWYLNVYDGTIIQSLKGGDRFREEGLLAVGKGNEVDVSEQLPHALDAYGIDYTYSEAGLVVYLTPVYKAWRMMKAGADIEATLNLLLLADLFSNISGMQTSLAGNLFKGSFRKTTLGQASKLWELPALKRGMEIEAIRAGTYRLPPGFPIVDVYNGISAISIKSLNLRSWTYQGRRLLYRGKRFVNKLIDFKGAQRGGAIVPPNAKKELEIIIPKNTATQMQWKMLNEVVDYGRINNITVRIIEF